MLGLMFSSMRYQKILLAITLTLVFACTSAELAEKPSCVAQKEWFPHNKTPRPDDNKFQSSSNCEFHQWSWQMFLWLTQNVNNQPRFLSFQSPYSLLGMDTGGLMPRMSKSASPETFDEYLQAGTDGILVDHQGRAVYYSQYINPTFAKFITRHHLTDHKAVQKFDPNIPFDISTLELKASWKIVAKGDNVKNYFTMKTRINKLKNKGGKIVIDPESTDTVTVALVGFHIGGVVKGHPEMIWATFEHKNNAPNVSDVSKDLKPSTIISDQDWLFYTKNTQYKNCNVNPADSPILKLHDKTQKLTPITQVCRQYKFGNDPDNPKSKIKSIKTNDDNIASLNEQVHEKLRSGDVWGNYYQVGAIWFLNKDSLQPGLALATDGIGSMQELTGSFKLSNSTIETFTQVQSTMNNCFRCHNTMQRFPPPPKPSKDGTPPKKQLDPLPALNLNISHAFVNIYFWSQQPELITSLDKSVTTAGN